MAKKQTSLSSVLCFIALIICAIIVLFTGLLPKIDINISGKLWDLIFKILEIIKNISILTVLIMGASAYAKTSKAKWTIYIIAIIIFVVGIVLLLI